MVKCTGYRRINFLYLTAEREVVRLTLVSNFPLEWVIAIKPHYMFLLFEAASLG